MDNGVAIKVEHVSKKYCKLLKRSMLYGVKDIGRNILGMSSHSDKLRKGEFWAVDDVSFELKKGETLGIIGPNGSGKTTMLKMLNGIFWPDKGKITVKGKVSALIAVGAGFHPLLTGRENIYINGAILGMSKREIDGRFDDIVEFADIGDFLDTPVKFYSSGMFVRLGFAVAVHCEPDVLLVDEVLSVGDYRFQMKCFNRIREMIKNCAVILVSHNLYSVQIISQKVIWLNKGSVMEEGATRQVIDNYIENVNRQSLSMVEKKGKEYVSKTDSPTEITDVRLLNDKNEGKTTFAMFETLKIQISYNARQRIEKIRFALGLLTADGIPVSSLGGLISGEFMDIEKGSGVIEYKIEKVPLFPRGYHFIISITDETGHLVYSQRRNCCSFVVTSPSGFKDTLTWDRGLVFLNHSFQKIK